MKRVYLALVYFLFAVDAYGQYTDVPYNDDPVLPGKRLVARQIKTETVYSYRFGNKGVKDSVLLLTKQYTYNDLHQLVKEETTTPDSKIKPNTSYLYNKYNEVVKMTLFNGKTVKGKPDYTVYEFQYDTLGHPHFIFKYNRDTSNLTTTGKIYNSKHQLISVSLKVGYGESFTIRNLTYNEDGDLYGLEYIDGNGNTTAEYAFGYNKPAKKRMVYLISKDKRKLYEVYTYTINKDHSKIEQFNYVDPKNVKDATPSQTIKYYYDENGLLGNEVTYQGNELVSFIKHFYVK
jgi:hypothetical protein